MSGILSEKQIKRHIDFLKKIINNPENRIIVELTSEWRNENFGDKNKPGVYAVFRDHKVIYVGETGNIKKRMADLGRTYNHSLRRAIGAERFGKKVKSNEKYNDHQEKKLDEYFRKQLQVSFVEVDLGRKELEEELIKEYGKEQLYNARERRK